MLILPTRVEENFEQITIYFNYGFTLKIDFEYYGLGCETILGNDDFVFYSQIYRGVVFERFYHKIGYNVGKQEQGGVYELTLISARPLSNTIQLDTQKS